jgi:hypothetical protein
MFSLRRTKLTHYLVLVLGISIGGASLWTETASAQTVIDVIKMPLDLIKDKVPTQLPNVNSNMFGGNLNNNEVNFCTFPCPQGGGMAPGGVPGGGIPQGNAIAPNGGMVPANAPRPQAPGPTINLPPIDLQKLF